MKTIKEITIIDYDAGNLFNLVSTLKKLNIKLNVTKNPKKIIKAEKIIIPGVGAFKEGIDSLKKRNLFYALKEFLILERPLLGICLGMQYLMSVSHEFKKTSGLNFFAGEVVKFDQNKVKKLPHIGWNYIKLNKNKIFKNINLNNIFYFCHSYYAKPFNTKNIIGKTIYKKTQFCSVINKNNIYGCQFHPERSGSAGSQFLNNFNNL